MNTTVPYWLLVGLVLAFGGIGAAIARTRGYSIALGFAVGWTGFLAWLILALLPRRVDRKVRVTQDPAGTEVGFPRVDSFLRVIYPLSLGLYFGLLGTLSVLGAFAPGIRERADNNPIAQMILNATGAGTALLFAVMFLLSLYLLVKDSRLPPRSRGPWTIGLIFLSMLAALFFIPWRWWVLRRQSEQHVHTAPAA